METDNCGTRQENDVGSGDRQDADRNTLIFPRQWPIEHRLGAYNIRLVPSNILEAYSSVPKETRSINMPGSIPMSHFLNAGL